MPDTITVPTAKTVTVDQPDAAAITKSALATKSFASTFEISCAETYNLAAEELRAIKAKAAKLDEQRKTITKPLDEAKKATMDLFRPAIALLEEAESAIKAAMLTFQKAESKRLAEEQAKREEEARAERARIQKLADEQAAAGNVEAAEVTRQIAEVVQAAPRETLRKVAGVSTSKVWTYEVKSILDLAAFVVAHPEYAACLTVDTKEVGRIVTAMRDRCPLAGIRVFEREQVNARRA